MYLHVGLPRVNASRHRVSLDELFISYILQLYTYINMGAYLVLAQTLAVEFTEFTIPLCTHRATPMELGLATDKSSP